MRAIKGPAVFLAQFAGDAPPFNSLAAIAAWAARLGFKGVQIPSWDRRLFDLEGGREPDVLRRRSRRPGRGRPSGDGTVDASAGPAGRRASRLRHGVRRIRGSRGAREATGTYRLGGRAAQAGGACVAPAWANRACD